MALFRVALLAFFSSKILFSACPPQVGNVVYPTTPADLVDCVNDFNTLAAFNVIDLGDQTFEFFSANGAADGTEALPSITNATALTIQNGRILRSYSLTSATSFRLIHVDDVGSLIIDDITIENGLANTGGLGNNGGAVLNRGTFEVKSSTISNNNASNGAGIYNQGTISTIQNSTLSANNALLDGGGIYNINTIFTIQNSTITENSANGRGSGIFNNFESIIGSSSFQSNIIAGNVHQSTIDIYNEDGTIINDGHNLIGTFNLGFIPTGTDVIIGTADPLLGPLQNNGGPTLTHAVLPGSLAIGKGIDAIPSLVYDQRGFPYTRDGGDGVVDIGAYEHQTCPNVFGEAVFDCR